MAKNITDEELFDTLDATAPAVEASDDELFGALANSNFSQALQERQVQNQNIENLKEHAGATAAVRGAIQGVTLGWGEELEAVAKAGAASMSGDERGFWEIYDDKRDQIRKENAISAELSPFLFSAAEVVGSIPTAFLSGGASAGYRGAAVLGGLSGSGFSNKTGIELLQDAALGATVGLAGEKIFRGVGNQVKKVFANTKNKQIVESMVELGETRRPENVEMEKILVKDIWEGKYGSGEEYFASKKAAERAVKGMDEAPELVNNIIKDEMSLLGAQRKVIQSQLDEAGIRLNFRPALEKLKEDIANLTESSAVKDIQKKYLSVFDNVDIGDEGLIVGGFRTADGSIIDIENMTLEQAHLVKKRIADRTYGSKNPENVYKSDKEASRALKNFTDTLLNEYNNVSGDIASLNKKFSILYDMQDIAPKDSKDFFKMTDKLAIDSRAKELREFMVLADNFDASSDFKTQLRKNIVTEINPRIKYADAVMNVQSLFGRADNALLFQLKGAHAAAGPLGVALSLGKGAIFQSAQVLNKAFKMPRTSSGIFRNYEQMFHKLKQLNPSLAVAFNDAIVGEDVESVKQLAKEASVSFPEHFEDGMGIDGELHPVEQQQLIQSIKADSSIGVRQKLGMIREVEAGLIPQPQSPQPPFFRDFKQSPRIQFSNGASRKMTTDELNAVSKGVKVGVR